MYSRTWVFKCCIYSMTVPKGGASQSLHGSFYIYTIEIYPNSFCSSLLTQPQWSETLSDDSAITHFTASNRSREDLL